MFMQFPKPNKSLVLELVNSSLLQFIDTIQFIMTHKIITTSKLVESAEQNNYLSIPLWGHPIVPGPGARLWPPDALF